MFPQSFLPNAAFFAIGCIAAVWLLRTGIVVWGTLALAGVALCADLALVARFGFDGAQPWFAIGLFSMQGIAMWAAMWLAIATARRTWSRDGKQLPHLIESAMAAYVRSDLDAARALYRRIRAADPWNVAARIGLANVAWRQGRVAEARRCLVAARRLDLPRAFCDLIDEQQRRLSARPKSRERVAPADAIAAAE